MQYPSQKSNNEISFLVLLLVVVVILVNYFDPGVWSHISLPHTSTSTTGQSAINSSMTTTQMINTEFGVYAGQALKIANCESGMNAAAVNPQAVDGSQATGLFQILYPSTWNTTSYAGQDPKDPVANTQAAYQIFARDGYNWHEWACARIVGL